MSARVFELEPFREAKRDAELRKRFGVDASATMLPIGMVATRVIDGVRLRMTERRNGEARR